MIYLKFRDKFRAKKFLELSLSGKLKFSGKEEAEKVKAEIEEAGGSVELK